jgi:V/A-type H+-transporting ATPase subunit I
VILNIITRLRSGDYEGGLLGRFGLVGVLFYWGSLGMAVKLAVAGGKPADWWLFAVLVVLPLVVLALHEPIYALLTRRAKLWHESALMGLFGGVLEALEAVMTYLANTFSFLRVAAFALSHVALCFTVFVLQGQVERIPAGKVWSALVFVVGTAVILGLEGLIVAIQIFRLEYYEFFTKFFSGEGKAFRPFRLDEGRP